jgi:hypothetical protein
MTCRTPRNQSFGLAERSGLRRAVGLARVKDRAIDAYGESVVETTPIAARSRNWRSCRMHIPFDLDEPRAVHRMREHDLDPPSARRCDPTQ